jgi:hypothetical protein
MTFVSFVLILLSFFGKDMRAPHSVYSIYQGKNWDYIICNLSKAELFASAFSSKSSTTGSIPSRQSEYSTERLPIRCAEHIKPLIRIRLHQPEFILISGASKLPSYNCVTIAHQSGCDGKCRFCHPQTVLDEPNKYGVN